jgi:methylenetetrahydrofolate--tRNA-(uracil-5-)-methyltransferase
MKPVGLSDPKTNSRPHAVVQLRKENPEGSHYSLVGFQTKLRYPEQKRIFQLIPALRHAEFARYGSLHRNTYLNAPTLLKETLQYKEDPRLFFAGQITGVEGYVESVATGIIAALNALEVHRKGPDAVPIYPPPTTAIGALLRYITQIPQGAFQPTNIHFGLFPPLDKKIKNRELRKGKISARAELDFKKWLNSRSHAAA